MQTTIVKGRLQCPTGNNRRVAAPKRPSLRRCETCGRRTSAEILTWHAITCRKPVAAGDARGETVAQKVDVSSSAAHLCFRWPKDQQIPSCVWKGPGSRCCDASVRGFSALVNIRGDHASALGVKSLVFHRDEAKEAASTARSDGTEISTDTEAASGGLGARSVGSQAAIHLQTPSGCSSRMLSVSLLKSALQKCVRLSREMPAVRVAIALLRHPKGGFMHLIRRVCIIAIEDAALIPHFAPLVWLLAATSRGYSPSDAPRTEDLMFVLETVQILAQLPLKDLEAASDENSVQEPLIGPASDCEADPELEALVYSVRVRASYGGMPGDVRMLAQAADLWRTRTNANAKAWRERIWYVTGLARKKIQPASVVAGMLLPTSVLRRGDIPLSAVDFHCSEIVSCVADALLANRQSKCETLEHIGLDRDTLERGIRRLMWYHRSSLTNKVTSWDVACGKRDPPIASDDAPSADSVVWDNELSGLVRLWSVRYLQCRGL